jgi:hypothetical protein
MSQHEKGHVGAMSTQDHPENSTTTAPQKPGDPPPGPQPIEDPKPTPGGQKPTGVPGQTSGNP